MSEFYRVTMEELKEIARENGKEFSVHAEEMLGKVSEDEVVFDDVPVSWYFKGGILDQWD